MKRRHVQAISATRLPTLRVFGSDFSFGQARLCLSEDTSRPTPSTLGPGMYFALTL